MDAIMAGVYSAAWQHRYHPLQDFLRLCEWDGTPRMDTFFHSICGLPVNDYYAGCSRLMFLALIERAFNPGTQMFTVVTFISPQGWGKSRLLKTLGDPWFMDTHLDLSNRDALMQIMGQWIVELSELASVRKTELEHLKGFLSSTKDFFRVPYGRTATFFPRSCVFFGTGNNAEFLTDEENRRWLPIQIPKPIDIAWVEKHRTQLFGEAFAAYVGGARWLDVYHTLVKPQQVAQQENFTFQDARADLIQRWLNDPTTPDRFTLADMMAACFPKEKMGVSEQRIYGGLLRKCGCSKRQERLPGTQERPTFWYKPEKPDTQESLPLPPVFPAISADEVPDV
jgi:predicted P-loop ATPase